MLIDKVLERFDQAIAALPDGHVKQSVMVNAPIFRNLFIQSMQEERVKVVGNNGLKCASCGKHICEYGQIFCGHCGALLDWGE